MRLEPRDRKSTILMAALRIARQPGGWSTMTRVQIAKEAHCAEGLVSKYLGSMDVIRRTLMKIAIKHEHFDLISQGLASGDPVTKKLTRQLKHKAAMYMIELGE